MNSSDIQWKWTKCLYSLEPSSHASNCTIFKNCPNEDYVGKSCNKKLINFLDAFTFGKCIYYIRKKYDVL